MKNQPKLIRFAALGAVLFCASVARAQGGMPDLSDFAGAIAKSTAPTQKATPGGPVKSSLSVPTVKPGTTSSSLVRQMRLAVEKQAEAQPEAGGQAFQNALLDLEKSMPKILTALEAEFVKQGFSKRDMGVTAGIVFVQLYETANNKVVSDKATKVAVSAIASAIDKGWAPIFTKLTPAAKEEMYETWLMGTAINAIFVEQFVKAGKTEEADQLREQAATMFRDLTGVPSSQVTIAADGRISGLAKK